MRKLITRISGLLSVALAFAWAGPAHAADVWTPFGNAEVVKTTKAKGKGNNWALSLVSDVTSANTDEWYAGLAYTPKDALDFADIKTLSADILLTDGCYGGGSPRFQITVATQNGNKNIFVYFGTAPNFDDCPEGWISTGNLIGSTDLRYDTTQLGGEFYDDYAGALQLAGDLQVVEVALVVDGGWKMEDGVQAVLVDNVTVNNVKFNANKGKK